MYEVKIVFIILIIEVIFAQRDIVYRTGTQKFKSPKKKFQPCKYNNDIVVTVEDNLPAYNKNQYLLKIKEDLKRSSVIIFVFDSNATLTPLDNLVIITKNLNNKEYHLVLSEDRSNLTLRVNGPPFGDFPYLTDVTINSQEYCLDNQKGYLDHLLGDRVTTKISTSTSTPIVDHSCGRRKVLHSELIVNGLPTKAGDWPWHAAIYSFERTRIDYICGGTLLNNVFILTAAHCVTLRGVPVLPETRNVILGKYNLVGGDVAPQEREIYKIIVHEGFIYSLLDNDIALLKLKSLAVYTDYVQPACLWYSDVEKQLPTEPLRGTVVGWGFDQSDSLSSTLQQATVPMVNELDCIKSNPLFYSRLLNSRKFCAGLNNGTSACNGDSGGGFLVFIPDEAGSPDLHAGAWHVRGIVSLSFSRSDAPICDPNHYVIFTDVAGYKDWLKTNMS